MVSWPGDEGRNCRQVGATGLEGSEMADESDDVTFAKMEHLYDTFKGLFKDADLPTDKVFQVLMHVLAAAFLSHTRPEDTEMAVESFNDELLESVRAIRAAKSGEA